MERYNDPASIDGEWLIYVVHEDGTLLAHPTAKGRVGENLLGAAGIDLAGNRVGPAILSTNEAGRWFRHAYFVNPENGLCEVTHSWAVRRGDVIIGSGWYHPSEYHSVLPSKCEPAHFTLATVERAIDRYRSEGREAAIAFHSSEQSVDGQWFTLIADAESGEIVAHPDESMVGRKLTDTDLAQGRFGLRLRR